MTLVKTSLLNGIAVVIRLATLLGINKVLAIYVGPAGYASLGQFQNAVQMISAFASGSVNTGVTKYTAEYWDNEKKQQMVWRTAGSIMFVVSFITAVVVAIYDRTLTSWFLRDESFRGVFFWFAGTLVFFSFNNLLLAILNGKKEVGRYVVANIAGSIFALLITAIMVVKLGLYGALVALAIYQSLTFIVTLFVCYKASWFRLNYIAGGFDKKIAINLSKYTGMALVSSVCIPLSHMLVRKHLGETFGWGFAGQWEAMWRLSSAYLMFMTSTLSVYYLPRISEIKKPCELKREMVKGYKIIFPFSALIGLAIYLFRDFIIQILFSEDFIGMRNLFAWQMFGDTLKIGSWLLAYLMIGKAMVKTFIVSEIIFAATFVLLTYWLTEEYGSTGVVMAYALNYLLYWIFVWCATASVVAIPEDTRKGSV